MIKHEIWMFITSADLTEMATKARKIEVEATVGDSITVKDWNCGDNVTVHVVVDQERARRKGLMV